MKLLLYHRGTAEGDEMSGALLYALLWWWMDGWKWNSWTGCLLNLIAICVHVTKLRHTVQRFRQVARLEEE